MQTHDVGEKYDAMIPGAYRGKYEEERWFSTLQRKAGYDMTKSAVQTFVATLREKGLSKTDTKKYLELGPGPGTWTREILESFPKLECTLVDISREMLKLAEEHNPREASIQYVVSDFLEYTPEAKFDVFFSSRAVEYFPDKELVVKKIRECVGEGALCSIITKTPQYNRPWNKKKGDSFHGLQVSDTEFSTLLKEHGFKNISVRPVTFVFPLLRSGLMDRVLSFCISWTGMNAITRFFSESYQITFEG